ncbi:MAG: M20 family metallopeptidase [Promethearchaeota archaeon]
MSEEIILKEIENNKEKYVEFFRDLIKTESFNPPGNEKNVALKIDEFLKESNIKCEIFPFGSNRANLIAYLNDKFENKNLLYNGHMDVVPPGAVEDWKYPPLSATVKRKKFIYGRGAADMKGGLAAMAIALKLLKNLNIDLKGNLIFNAVADEETGGKFGTQWCLDNKLKSIKCDFAIVGESSNYKPLSHAIVLGEKGRVQLKIIAKGVSGHASVPFLGKNAIYMMNNLIQNLDKLDDLMPKINPPISLEELKTLLSASFPTQESFERVYNEQPLLSNVSKALTQFTKMLTMIKAGIKENVIPDHCEAIMDFRLLPGQTKEMILKALKKLITDIGYEIKDAPKALPEETFFYLEVEEASEPSYWSDWENSKDLKNFYDIVEKYYGKKPFYFLLPASADVNYLRNTNYCKSSIIFGPGVGTTAHAVDEYVEIEDFINAIKVYTLFAYHFLK